MWTFDLTSNDFGLIAANVPEASFAYEEPFDGAPKEPESTDSPCPRAGDYLQALISTDAFKRWFAGSHVTEDSTIVGKPIMVFRGCTEEEVTRDDQACAESQWFTSSRMNASSWEGAIANCFVRLLNPLIITTEEMLAARLSPEQVTHAARLRVETGAADWDGVIMKNVVCGSQQSDIYVVFAKDGSVAHAVRRAGHTRYREADGAAYFTGLQPSENPDSFGRSDVPGQASSHGEVRNLYSALFEELREAA